MRHLIEPSHLDLCCLQKLLLSPMAVKELNNGLLYMEKCYLIKCGSFMGLIHMALLFVEQ